MPTESYSHTEKCSWTQSFPQGPGVLCCRVLRWDGVQAWRCPTASCRSSLPMALEVREPPPRPLVPDIILRLCIGAGAGFATVQPLGANIHTLAAQDLAQTREG